MNAEAVRARVVATLSADANVRRAAELELKQVSLPCSLFAFHNFVPFCALPYPTVPCITPFRCAPCGAVSCGPGLARLVSHPVLSRPGLVRVYAAISFPEIDIP